MKKMIRKLAVIAVTTGLIAFTSCRTEQLTPEQDGRNLAAELCDCFLRAGENVVAKLACFTSFQTNADRWTGADREALQTAFDEAIQNCETSPFDWYFAHQASIAVAEFCAFATELYPEEGNMMLLAPLFMRWEALLNSGPAFLNPFFAGLMGCRPAADWILCTFGDFDFCPQPEDEELIALAREAAPEFCDFFTANPGADMNALLGSPLARFAPNFAQPIFIATLLQELATCATTPMWFICQMTGGQDPRCP